jgi:hypothetical protein
MRIIDDLNTNTNHKIGGSYHKERYNELVKLLVSRDPTLNYAEISDEILSICKSHFVEEIPRLYGSHTIPIINSFFENSDMIADTNYIGKINIVMLQCASLCQKAAKIKDPSLKLSALGTSFNENNYKEIIEILKKRFESTSTRGTILEKIFSGINFSVFYYSHLIYDKIFFITLNNYLTIKEINLSYFDNIFYCGFTCEPEYADGGLLSSVGFIVHDFIHAGDFLLNSTLNEVELKERAYNISDVKKFYNYCNSIILSDDYCRTKTIQEKKFEFNLINFIIFLLIHEVQENKLYFPPLPAEKILDIFLKGIGLKRFTDKNDLNLAININYRSSEEKIIEYLKMGIDKYIEFYNHWIHEENISKISCESPATATSASSIAGSNRIGATTTGSNAILNSSTNKIVNSKERKRKTRKNNISKKRRIQTKKRYSK